MKKRFLSIILSLSMCLILLPAEVWAVDYGNIPELGIKPDANAELKKDTYYLIENGSATTEGAGENEYNFYYASETRTLTLQNAVLTNALYVPYGTTVNLVGDNRIGMESSKSSVGIQANSNKIDPGEESGGTDTAITVTGEGSLTVYCLNEGIVCEQGDIVIHGGTIKITNNQSTPIEAQNGGITIDGSADVTATSGNGPIKCKKDLNIGGSAKVTVGGDEIQIALSSDNKIIISGQAVVNAASSNMAITGFYGIEVLDSAKVTATSSRSAALNSHQGSVVIKGTVDAKSTGSSSAAVDVGQDEKSTGSVTVTGSLTASGYVGIGLSSTGNIIVDGGSVTADATLVGIFPMGGGNIEIKNQAEVSATASFGYGIFSNGGTVSISNSTVEADTEGESYRAFGNVPTLTYDDSYKVYAGSSKSEAKLIAHDALTEETYKSKYIRIKPVPASERTVTGIEVEAPPDKLVYTAGEALDLTGLTIKVTYSDGSAEILSASDSALTGLTSDPAIGTALTVPEHNGKPVTVTYGGRTCTTGELTVKSAASPTRPAIPTVQKPTIDASEGAEVTLNSGGTDAAIHVADGYELVDVTVNGVSKGAVTALSGLKTGDLVVVVTQKQADPNEALIEAVKNSSLAARSMYAKAPSGKQSIKVYWFNRDGSKLDFDGYEVYRSVKRYSGYGTKPIFETTKARYYNTAIEKGTRYYYKVRGYKLIDGEKVYTPYSLKAWRLVK